MAGGLGTTRSSAGSGGSCARAAARAAASLLPWALLTLTACASEDGTPAPGGLGVMRFALSAAVPDAKYMSVYVYEGPQLTPTTEPAHKLDCFNYLRDDGSVRSPFTIDQLPVRNDYAVRVDLFSDKDATGCKNLVVTAYRGGIAVSAIGAAEAETAPYYLQPLRPGQFTGMAQASQDAQSAVAKQSCEGDADCSSAHPAATCVAKKCSLRSLFPLNGGASRGLPGIVTLGDGRVAIHGGVAVHESWVWTATSQRIEIFDPRLGRFVLPAATIAGFEDQARVALPALVPALGAGASLVSLGGSGRLLVRRDGANLKTGLDDLSCSGATCPVSGLAYRVDLTSSWATALSLPLTRSLPVVARVQTPQGSRLLVLGGATTPLPKSGDPRLGDALLCQVEGTLGCEASKAKLVAGRAYAATLCLDPAPQSAEGCKRLLVLGGRANKASPLAEIYNATKDEIEQVTIAAGLQPSALHGGTLVRLSDSRALLLGATEAPLFLDPTGGTAPGAAAPLVVTIDESSSETRLVFAAASLGSFAGGDAGKRALGTAVAIPGGALWIGGIDAAGKISADALVFNSDGEATGRTPLGRPRYGAAATTIGGQGPFGGCVLLAGGFGSNAGVEETLSHVELYCPPKP